MNFEIIEIDADGHLNRRFGVAGRRMLQLGAEPEPFKDDVLADWIFVTGKFPECVVFEVVLPGILKGSNLRQALQFELEARLPVALDRVEWGYRSFKGDGRHFRLFAVGKRVLENAYAALREQNWRCDCLIPTQVIAAEAQEPVEALLQYLKEDFDRRQLSWAAEVIPLDLKPVRYRRSQRIYWLLSLCLLGLAFIFLGGKYQDFRQKRQVLDQLEQNLKRELTAAQRQFGELSAEHELLQTLKESKIGLAVMAPVLNDWKDVLPETMWVSSVSQSDGAFDLVIVSAQDDPALYKKLEALPNCDLINVRKSSGGDQQMFYYVKLWSRRP
ncbi:hypothetical protein [Victivallis sp. Marseille-Q1083]|uniref:hypothetical protein n=1 Tax=Victivallis sp. Marseille-Q1083 TaxID=2717288 RepID=UPI00158BFF84|nr:hypothetical protein [Victivallis sp. Marseille-Q1083]